MAGSEQKLKGVLKRFKKYLERKGLTLSTEKSKVLVFESGIGNKISGLYDIEERRSKKTYGKKE